MVDVPNLLRLAHLADGIGSSEIVNRYAGPSLVWHFELAPFSGHGFGPHFAQFICSANICFTSTEDSDIKARIICP